MLGAVHLLLSTRTIAHLTQAFWKITGAAAVVSVVILILVLSVFLRKTVANERKLRAAEDQNLQLSQQLHEAQRELMNVEKLARDGTTHRQLRARDRNSTQCRWRSSATVGGGAAGRRFSQARGAFRIINGELSRIEKIVKGFLQTTAKPVSQPQLVDLNKLVEKTLTIVRPRVDRLGARVFWSSSGPWGRFGWYLSISSRSS